MSVQLAIAVPLQLIHSQEVKPTVEQCRADQKLWTAERLDRLAHEWRFDSTIEEVGDVRVLSKKKRDEPSYTELMNRAKEMFGCLTVDPDNERTYYNTMSGIYAARGMRLENFLLRHSLWKQFLAEDAQGKLNGVKQ